MLAARQGELTESGGEAAHAALASFSAFGVEVERILEVLVKSGGQAAIDLKSTAARQQGSMMYAEVARRRSDDIRLMASIETIGWYSDEPGSQSYPPLFNLFYPNRADFSGIVSNFRSRAAMQPLAAAFRANSDFPLETVATFPFVRGVSWSDHGSFWRQGLAPVDPNSNNALSRFLVLKVVRCLRQCCPQACLPRKRMMPST